MKTKIKAAIIKKNLENNCHPKFKFMTIEGPLSKTDTVIQYSGTISDLKLVSFDSKYNFLIKPILKFIEYNFSAYLKGDKTLNIFVQIETIFFDHKSSESLILQLYFPNNIKILDKYNFDIKNVPLTEFISEDESLIIDNLSKYIFKNVIGDYTDIYEYKNKIEFTSLLKEILRLKENDITIINNYLFNIETSLSNFCKIKSYLFHYKDFNDKTSYFSIKLLNENKTLSLDFFLFTSNIYFKNNKNSLQYIFPLKNNFSIKEIQENIFNELKLIENFSCFEEILQLLNINSIINY